VRRLFASVIVLVGCSTAMTPRAATREAIVAYVDRAAAVVAAEGPRACDTLRTRSWFAGDWYVFVLAADGRTVCHPSHPEMVGTMAHELVDANGMRFGDEFVRVAGQGGGWVDYIWKRPGDPTPVSKSSYVRSVTAADGEVYVIGSGGYGIP
jgi:signal transduction histidine kinase